MSLHNLNKHVVQVWLWLLVFLLALLLVFVLALQYPAWQRYAARQVSAYLAGKLKTQVHIGFFRTDWRHHFVLEEFYLEDQHQDTLLYAEKLGVNLDFAALLRNQVRISKVSLEQALLQVKATLPDSAYNFDFIRAAFAAPNTAKADSIPALSYDWGDLQLSQVRVLLQDSVRGNYIRAQIGHFQAQRNWFRPRASALQYRLLDLQHAAIHYRQTKISSRPASPLALDLGFRELQVKDVHLDYAATGAAQQLQAVIGTAVVVADTFILKRERIALASIQVSNSSLAYYQGKKLLPDSAALRPARTVAQINRAAARAAPGWPPNWKVNVQQVRFRHFQLAVGNYKPDLGPQVLDFNHLLLQDFNLDLDSLIYRRRQASARLQNLSLLDKSGFRVAKLAGNLLIRSRQVMIRQAAFQTPFSRLSPIKGFQLDWSDRNHTRFLLEASLVNSLLSPKDLAYLAPYLSDRPHLPEVYRHAIRLQGYLAFGQDRIRAQSLRVKGLSATEMLCSGELSGLTNDEPTRLNLQVHRLLTTRADAPHLLPAGTLPAGLRLPARLQLRGHFSGSTADLHLRQVALQTSDGARLDISGTITKAGSPQKWISLQVQQYSTPAKALLHLLPAKTVSQDLQLPATMVFSGSFQGASLQRYQSRLRMQSSFGEGDLNLAVAPGERFSGSTRLLDFDLGKFLREEKVLGRATGQASFTGQGFTFATTRVRFQASIQHIIYNRAPYRNIELQGTLDKETYQVQGGLAKVVVQKLGNKLKKLSPKKILQAPIKKVLPGKKARLRKRGNR